MKHSTLLVLAVLLGPSAAMAAQQAPKPQAKGVAAKKVASTKETEDKRILDAYLKALGKKWGYTIALDPKGGNLIVQSSPADKEKLSVDMAGVTTEDDIEAKLIAKLIEAKKIAQRDNPDKVPVYYQSDGKAAIADADAAAVDAAIKQAGQVKRAVISPKKDNGALVASLDLQDNYSYRQVKIASDQQSTEEYKSAKSAYFNYNEWLKKRAASAKGKVKGEGPTAGNEAAIDKTEGALKQTALAGILPADAPADVVNSAAGTAVRGSVNDGKMVQGRDGSQYFMYTAPGAKTPTVVPVTSPGSAPDVAGAAATVRDQLLKGNDQGAKLQAALAAAKGTPVVPPDAAASRNLEPKPNLTAVMGTASSPTAVSDKSKVGGAGCNTPADIFRSDAERYKAHQESALADKANGNQKTREKIDADMSAKIDKINADCAEKLGDPMLDGASKKVIQDDCGRQIMAAKKDALSQLMAVSRAKEQTESDAARKATGNEIDAYYNASIAKTVPGIQQSYKNGKTDEGLPKKSALADEVGIDAKYLKDSYIDDYFSKNWQGDAGAGSIDGCRQLLGVGTNPTPAAVDGKCVHDKLVAHIKGLKGKVSSGAPNPTPTPTEPGNIDQQIQDELNPKKK